MRQSPTHTGVRALALQGALVGDARVAVGLGVGHVGAVLLVLAGVHEVDAVGIDRAQRRGREKPGVRAQAHEVAAEG